MFKPQGPATNKRFDDIDYDFRPQSYWDISDPLAAILVNVKGRRRREMIRDYWNAGAIDQLEKELLLDSLSEEQREGFAKIHPSFMGGEYLPDYAEGEVEIARIELQSTTVDVISIRARKEGEKIVYSVVDEYETEFHVSPSSSAKPLSLEQVIDLTDNAGGGESLALHYTKMNYRGRSRDDLDRIRFFTRVESVFYPQLNLHYEKVLGLWYEEEKAKLIDRPGATEGQAGEEATALQEVVERIVKARERETEAYECEKANLRPKQERLLAVLTRLINIEPSVPGGAQRLEITGYPSNEHLQKVAKLFTRLTEEEWSVREVQIIIASCRDPLVAIRDQGGLASEVVMFMAGGNPTREHMSKFNSAVERFIADKSER